MTASHSPPPDANELVRSPVDMGKPWRPLQPAVDTRGHMALGTPSEIAKHSDRHFAAADAPPPRQEFSDPAAGGFIGMLNAAGTPDEVVASTKAWLETGTAKPARELAAVDAADLKAAQEELRGAWGEKYDSSMQAVARYVDAMPAHEARVLHEARDPETGRSLFADPAQMVRLAGLARAPQPQAMTIAGIEAFMRSNRAAYSKSESLQARYRELVDQREQGK